MNHLPLPTYDLTRPLLHVPYLCILRLSYDDPRFSYDDGGFITYPYRVGIDIDEICRKDAVKLPILAPFLQAWLWFGLLGDILGMGSRDHVKQKIGSLDNYVEALDNGKIVLNTARLRDFVVKRREITTFPLAVDTLRERFDACLNIATRAVNNILNTLTCQKDLSDAESFQDLQESYLVLLSIQILIATLRSYRNFLFLAQPHLSIPKMVLVDSHLALIELLCRDAGWFRFQLDRMDDDLQIKYFLSSTFKHLRCSEEDCKGDGYLGGPSSKEDMRPLHTAPGCCCNMVQIEPSTIASITSEQRIPLLTYGKRSKGQRDLEIQSSDVASSLSYQYIAFSHVRNRGLGNTTGLGLPHCQLALLQDMANSAAESQSALPMPFYIDKLCVPLDVERKKKALQGLPGVFRHAYAVVVLDPCLTRSTIGSDIDCLLRIRYSDWKNRVWTLQEGALAKKLLFSFTNRTVDIDELLTRFEPDAPLSMLARTLETCPQHQEAHGVLARVLAFDRDVKSFKHLSSVAGPDTKLNMRAILRLGYLGVPRYHFLRQETEQLKSCLVLYTLEETYLEGLVQTSDEQESIGERLRRIYPTMKGSV